MAGASASPENDALAYRPLLTERARRLAGAVIVLATIVITVSGMNYANADQHRPGWLDLTLDGYIRSHVPPDQPAVHALASLGNPAQTALFVVALAGVAAAAKRWSGVLLTIVGTLASVTITELVLKPLIGRLSYGHLSFPSGHATAVAAVALSTVIVIAGARWPRSSAIPLVASLAAVTVGVAISLIAEHVHYATDTIGGCCVAVATVLTVALGLDRVAPHIPRGSNLGL